jgi:hypothetical protein
MALGEPCSYDFGVEHWPDVAGLSADTGVLTPATSHPEWVSLWRRRFRGRSLAVVSASAAGGTDAIGTCEALLRVLRGRGFTIAFVAHSASDLRIAEAVAGKGLASVALVEEPESMMALFGEATIHVGGRYHDVLLSGVAGCRIVALPGDSAGLDGLCRHMQIGSPLPWDCGEDMLATAIDLCQPMAHSRASVLADLAVSSAFLPERRRLTAEVEEVQYA